MIIEILQQFYYSDLNYIHQIVQFALQDKYVGKQIQKYKIQFLIKEYILI